MAASPDNGGLAAALIVAAGSGRRMGAGGPKALVGLAGRPLYEYALDAAVAAKSVGPIVIAVPPGKADEFEAVSKAAQSGEVRLVDGGETRSHSVAAGLAVIDSDLVVVHDAARPLAGPDLIDRAVAMLSSSPDLDAVIAAAPVTDTVKRVDPDGRVEQTLDRSVLRAAQTPQVFRRSSLQAAIASGDLTSATDDASLIEAAGGAVAVLDSPSFNIKVTAPEDLAVAEVLLARRN